MQAKHALNPIYVPSTAIYSPSIKILAIEINSRTTHPVNDAYPAPMKVFPPYKYDNGNQSHRGKAEFF